MKMSVPLHLEPHWTSWKIDFETEGARILAEVESLGAVDAREDRMEVLGYEAMGEFGIPGRRYFRKSTGGVRSHHVHAFVVGSPELVRHLAFRDYLRCHADVAREYNDLKLRLADSCKGDLEAYINGKDAFIKRIEREALAWRAAALDVA